MVEPKYLAKGTLGDDTDSNCSFTYPAGIVQNHLLVLFVTSIGLGAISVDPSWSPDVSGVFPAIPVGAWKVYMKIATGLESGAEVVSRSGHSGSNSLSAQVYQFEGVPGVPFKESSAYITTGGSGNTITLEPTVVSGDERTLLGIVYNYNGAAPTTPSGYTEEASDAVTGGSYLKLFVKENVSSDGSITASNGSVNGWAAVHICLATRGLLRSQYVN